MLATAGHGVEVFAGGAKTGTFARPSGASIHTLGCIDQMLWLQPWGYVLRQLKNVLISIVCRPSGSNDVHRGDNSVIGRGARLAGTTLGPGCTIESETELPDVSLGECVTVDMKCVLSEARLGRASGVARESCVN